MKSEKHYKVQLVGNVDTVKRMVASLYLVDAKKKGQTLKVCICDDLPHVINAVESQQRSARSHDLLESGLTLQVAYGRSLTIRTSLLDDNGLCVITPQQEVVIPPSAIWESNAAFATDFQLVLVRPYEDAPVQVSITSQDDLGSDIPLSVPPRVHVSWHPKDVAGVNRIRKTWETEPQTLPRGQSPSQRKSSSLPRYQQPIYQGIEKMLQERPASRPEGHVSPRPQGHISPRLRDSSSPRPPYLGKPLPQDKNWNVVTSPTLPTNGDGDLPQWAKGYGEQYDYDDVVVV